MIGNPPVEIADQRQRHIGPRHLDLELRQLIPRARQGIGITLVATLDALLHVAPQAVDHPEQRRDDRRLNGRNPPKGFDLDRHSLACLLLEP